MFQIVIVGRSQRGRLSLGDVLSETKRHMLRRGSEAILTTGEWRIEIVLASYCFECCP